MLKHLEVLYYEMFKEPLKNYRIFKPRKKTNPQAYVLIFIFVLVLTMYLLEFFEVLNTSYVPLRFLIVVGGLCFILPILYIMFSRKHTVIFTEKGLFKHVRGARFDGIPFNAIKKVLTDHENHLALVSDSAEISFKYKDYDETLMKVNTVLKFRGFFNDKPVDYEITFTENDIVVEEIVEVMDDETSQLFERFINKYQYLTPGFVEDIIFYNIQTDHIQLTEGKHVIFFLTHLDVKPTHPENTHFKAQKTDDAIIIFENVADVQIHNIDESGGKPKLLGTNIQTLRDTTKKAVIFDAAVDSHEIGWKIVFTMSHGVKKQRVRFAFTQIIVGWNKLVQDSWFEK